jgi:hypothetical protein
MKIVSINGQAPGEYFRQWGKNVLRLDENDGEHLNEILQYGAYSIRVSHTHDVPPASASDTYVLESANGQQVTVEMPWLFAPRGEFGLGQWPLDMVESTEEFVAHCQWKSDTEILVNGYAAGGSDITSIPVPAGGRRAADAEFTREIMEKRDMVAELYKANGGAGYFEKPRGRRDQQLEIIVPHQDHAEVKQMGDRATFIHLDSFVGDWKEEVIAGTDHACANSDRLVLDMRGNGGGYIDQIEWLTTHLFPDRTQPFEYSLPGRFLASSPARQELSERMADFNADYFGDPSLCWWGYEAACLLDVYSGATLSDKFWMSVTGVVENRGGVPESLTQEVTFLPYDAKYAPGSDPIACPGKFRDDTLVIFSNGTGASAGHFFPEIIRDQAVMVTAGGYLGEPLVSGIARGGAVWAMNGFEAWVEQYFQFFYGPATDPLPYLVRDADSYIEQPAAYKSDLSSLYVDDFPVGDLHIDVWTNSPGSDAYVYGKVLNAVQKWKSK